MCWRRPCLSLLLLLLMLFKSKRRQCAYSFCSWCIWYLYYTWEMRNKKWASAVSAALCVCSLYRGGEEGGMLLLIRLLLLLLRIYIYVTHIHAIMVVVVVVSCHIHTYIDATCYSIQLSDWLTEVHKKKERKKESTDICTMDLSYAMMYDRHSLILLPLLLVLDDC